MASPRSFRGDHWTLNRGMLRCEVEDGAGLCGDSSRHASACLITDGSLDDPRRSEHIANGILRSPCESCPSGPVTHVNPSGISHREGRGYPTSI